MKQLKFLLLILIFFFSSNPVFAEYYEEEDSGITREKVYHVYEDIDLIPKAKVAYDKPRIVVRATYPLLASENIHDGVDGFNMFVDDLIDEAVASFKNQALDKQPLQKNMTRSTIKNELTIDFDTAVVNTSDKPIIGIRFNVQGYISGMAHPFHRHQVLNFDLDTGQKIELSDLFKKDSNYLEFLSNYSRVLLDKKLKNKDMIMEGTAPIEENFKNWTLSPGGLLITFDEYQVAAYVFGTQTVLIPYAALKPLIAPDSPIANCLKHQKRCLRNKLLTGGFMDEA